MDVTPYRKAYFALCKKLGIDEDLRHDFNEAQTGNRSTKSWSVDDWRQVVAELQRRAGMNVQPGRPRIRRGHETEGDGITPGQLEFISALAAEISWSVGVTHFIRGRLLTPLRKANWDGRPETLFASEASNAIAALRNMRDRQNQKHQKETAQCNSRTT